MKRISGLTALLLSVLVNVSAQVDTTLIYNTSMPYGTLDLRVAKSPTRYYYLQEGITFSFRQTPDGVKTNTFKDMTASWNSSPYQQGNMREKNGNSDQFVLNYRILFPQKYDAAYKPGYPIIMMLHGAGETGNCWGNNCHWADPSWNPVTNNPPAPTDQSHELLNNDRNLFHGGLPHLNAVNAAAGKYPDDATLSSKAFPGIVLFPQSLNGWSQPVKVEEAIKLLRLIIKKYNIDENRVYIHGLSNGGWGVNQALKRAPWLFACAATMSAVSDAEIPQHNMPEVSKLPLWIFQGGQDTNPTPSKTFNWVKKLRDAGTNVRYYLYPSLGHGTWNTAYKEPDFFTWILQQRKYNPHISYGTPVICNTTGTGVRIAFSKGFLAYQWQKDGVLLTGEVKEELIANTPGVYRGRFSRKSSSPTESQWEQWSDPITVTEINPAKPSILVEGTTHLRGPGLTGNDVNNTVKLRSSVDAELYDWYKNGQLVNFQNTDIDDTLKTATFTSGSSNANGAYTLVIRNSYCPSPASEPVYLFFNNSAPQSIALNATAFGLKGSPSSSSVFLTWNDVVENELGYEIWRKKQGTASFAFVAKTPRDAISYLDKGLEPSSTYEYKIRAVSKSARSNYIPSDNLNTNFVVTTQSDKEIPSPPQNLATTYNTVNSVSIKWDPANDDNGIKEYVIQYGTSQITVPANTTSYTIENLQANSNYPITIIAVDYAGHQSQPSNEIIGTTFVSGLYYKHSTGVWSDLDDTTMVATFKIPEFTGWVSNFTLSPRTQEDYFNFEFNGYFNLTQSGAHLFRITSDDGSRLFIDDSLTIDNDGKHGNKTITSDTLQLSAGVHSIKVQYFDNEGNQNLVVQYAGPGIGNGQTFITIPESALKSGEYVAPVLPLAPGNLTATAAALHKINLTWSASDAASYYEIFRSESAAEFRKIANETKLVFTDTIALKPGTAYQYKIRAVNQNGSSAYSNTASVSTPVDDIPPTAPTDVKMQSKSPSAIALTWSASTDNDAVAAYEVYINEKLAGTSTTNSYTITNLNSNVYSITVKAIDGSGNTSVPSSEITVDNTIPGLYYSIASGDLTDLNTWKKTSEGTGPSPLNFTDPGQTFVIVNRQTASVDKSWAIGQNSKVIVTENIALTVNAECNCTIDLRDNATLKLLHASTPQFKNISPTSTIEFAGPAVIPSASYGNIILTGGNSKTFAADSTIIAGDLVMDDMSLLGPDNETTIVVGGNVVVNETASPVMSQAVHFIFTSNTLHTFQLPHDLSLSKISVLENSTVKINNAAPMKLTVGTASGGGLMLSNGSLLDIGDIDLYVAGSGAINPTNTDGRIAFENNIISIQTSSKRDSYLYADADRHTTGTLKVALDSSGKLKLGSTLSVRSSFDLDEGVVSSNGFLTLLASATEAATIEPIENASIEGSITVQQYYAPLGINIVREIATPVAGVKVEKLQQMFPVTGNFQGASNGSGEASMFTSNGILNSPKAFPTSSNQETLQVGKGYITNFLTANDTSALTLMLTGTPILGEYTASLLPGNANVNEGWNLVGNPYVSNVKLDNNLQRSGIGNIVIIRESSFSNDEAVSRYRYFDLASQQPVIKSGQAFWVQAGTSTPSLKWRELNKTNETQTTGTIAAMTVSLTHAEMTDETYVRISDSATDGYDVFTDAPKVMNRGTFSLSTNFGGNNYAVNTLKKDVCTKTLPLTISNPTEGEYEFSFANIVGLGIAEVRLIDHFTGEQRKLTDNSVYNFQITSDISSYSDRFELILYAEPPVEPNIKLTASCNGEDAIIEIDDASGNHSFTIVNQQGQSISESIPEAGIIKLKINSTKLSAGVNTFSLRTSIDGCPGFITTPYKLEYPDRARLTPVEEEKAVCSGSNAPLTVSSNTTIAEYTWMDSEMNVLVTTSTPGYLVESVTENQTIYVTGTTNASCKTDTVAISLRVEAGPQAVLSLSHDTLSVDIAGTYEWYRNGSPYATTTEPFLVVQDSGTYVVAVSTNVCVAGSNAVEYGLLTPTEPETSVSIEIFPVPSDGHQVSVLFKAKPTSQVTFRIIDTMGQTHFETPYAFVQDRAILQFSKPLATGVYLLQVKDSRQMKVIRFTVK